MRIVDKPWGYQEFYIDEKDFSVKKIVINKGHRYSLQYHKIKKEKFIVINGYPQVQLDTIIRIYMPKQEFDIPATVIHRISAIEENVDLLEISWGSEEDIIRLSDDYGRINEQKE